MKHPKAIIVFEDEKNSVNLRNIQLVSVKSEAPFLTPRGEGNLAGHGFYLTDSYNWQLVTDNKGVTVLVPTRKE